MSGTGITSPRSYKAAVEENQPLLESSMQLKVNDSVEVNYLEGYEDATVPENLLDTLASLQLCFQSKVQVPKGEIDQDTWRQRVRFSGAKFQRLLDELASTSGRMAARSSSSRSRKRLEYGLSRINLAAQENPEERFSTALNVDIDQDMVDALLQLGVEEHFKIINKMIFGGEERLGIDVTFHNLSFDVAQGKQYLPEWLTGPATVGNQTGRMCCGWAYRLKAFFHQLCSRDALNAADDLQILHPMSGAFKAGEITLVLGPAGAGKSTLMHALSGRIKSTKYQELGGDIKFNGYDMKDVHVPNIATYVSQLDVHLPTLTVRDTLNFSKACRDRVENISQLKNFVGGNIDEAKFDEEAVKKYMDNRVRIVLALLGLTRAADTIIGNEVLKGVSGGEKRRVTLGEMLVVGSKVLLLDEISTGLDAAATFDITKTIKNICSVFNVTGIVSLLQPPPETFEIFDNVILLAEGRVVYHGPRAEVLDYFTSLGFRCPASKDTADFLQEVTLENGGKEYMVPGAENVPIGPVALEERFKQTHYYREMQEVIAKRNRPVEEQNQELSEHLQQTQDFYVFGSKYAKSIGQLSRIVFARQWLVLKKNVLFIIGRAVTNMIFGLLLGALAFQLPFDQYYIKVGMLNSVLMFCGFGSVSLLQEVVESRDVYYKQHKENFYPAISYVLADFCNNLPISVLDSLVLGSIVYFMVGFTLAGGGSHYFVFLLFLISFGICMSSLIRLLGYTFKTQAEAMATFIIFIMLMIIFSGGVVTRNAIPDYFIWIYWINPITWAYTSIVINEFDSDTYNTPPRTVGGVCVQFCGHANCTTTPPPMNCGTYFLLARGFVTDPAFLWGGLGFLWGWIIMLVGLSIYALTYIHHDEKVDGAGGDVVKHSSHFVEPDGSSGLTLFKKKSQDNKPTESRISIKDSAVTPVTLSWRSLKYSVEVHVATEDSQANHRTSGIAGIGGDGVRDGGKSKNKTTMQLDILQSIDGYAKPREMTALMGSSGAGKTTLMDVLAGRKTTGTITGEIYVNGSPQNLETFPKICGYVEQFGVHLENATVRESLEFSAVLRLGADESSTRSMIQEVLELLELNDIENHLVGDAATGLSFEEVKRLTIGVELVSDPSIVFADEPTSGLEARSAMVVMKCLRNIAKTGRTVVATVHQPSTAVFNMFDNLLLLKRGGEVVFFDQLGENSCNLKNYFEQYPGVDPCPSNINPATWMLTDVIGAGVSEKHSEVDFASEYRQSASYEHLLSELDEMMPLKWEASEVTGEVGGYPTSFGTQFAVLLKRNFLIYWRQPSYSLVRFVMMLTIALVVGLVFVGRDVQNASTIQSRVAVINIVVTIIGNYNIFVIVPFLFSQKALFYRERSSQMYSTWAYTLAGNIIEDPYIFIEVALAVLGFYFLAGLILDPVWIFFYYFLITWLYAMLMTFMGMLFAAVSPTAGAAQLLVTLASQLFGLFSGIGVLPSVIPDWLIWLYYISPQRWTMEALLTSQFNYMYNPICNPNGIPQILGATGVQSDCNPGSEIWNVTSEHGDRVFFCCPEGNQGMTARDYVLGPLFLGGKNGFFYSNIWYDVLYLVLVTLACRILGGIALAKLNFNKR
mmetsp:Transcript_7924/g.14521  ORF Transcript_7924/g.14521 Transcript_7924/m.14521 type:complete len:1594 (+) Transcript_7924:169-4950(+)